MIEYLKNNLLVGLKTSPFDALKISLTLTFGYAIIAALVGFNSKLLELGIIRWDLAYILPFSLFIFPSFLEEAFFRGILIPNNAKDKGRRFIIFITLVSTVLFVLWHPLNALTANPGARKIFLNPNFLFIVFCLGLVCSLSYIYSRSLWAPVIIHWLTVFFWVFFLGGRNLILK
jgi:predicted Abi (CAAX) family protease